MAIASSAHITAEAPIQPHNTKPASMWSSGGPRYDQISRGIADSIEHCVLRLNPQPSERVLDLATGTGWTSRLVAARGARVVGADIAGDLIAAARERAQMEGLDIEYRLGDAENLLGCRVEEDDLVRLVDRDDRVHGRLEDSPGQGGDEPFAIGHGLTRVKKGGAGPRTLP